MLISHKCRYALSALLELSRRYGQGPVSSSAIAEAQGIPQRFLEAILSQLTRGGFIASRRGNQGGYVLIAEPAELAVGVVVRFVQGSVDIGAARDVPPETCSPQGECAFMGMWERVGRAISEVLDTTTFRDLLEEEARLKDHAFIPSYAI